MTNAPYGPPSDRWNVNLPAVIGVIFVFLIGVIVWVVVSTSGDDDETSTSTSSPSSSTATTAATTPTSDTTGVTDTTTPAPMPDLTTLTSVTSVTSVPTTVPPTTAAPTTAPPPPTTAAGAEEGAVLGDLAVPGRPMQAPPCDDSYITIIASAVGDQATPAGIADVLESYPTSEYLRTDQTCPSLNPSVDGQPIYVVYFGPFPFESDACAARADGTEGAYAKQLSDDRTPEHVIDCS